MKELGISDVEDVSDVDISDAEVSAAAERLGRGIEGAGGAGVDSDWDDTVASDILPGAGAVTANKAPLTARVRVQPYTNIGMIIYWLYFDSEICEPFLTNIFRRDNFVFF